MVDIVGSLLTAFNADPLGAGLLLLIGLIIGIISDRIISYSMMGGMMV